MIRFWRFKIAGLRILLENKQCQVKTVVSILLMLRSLDGDAEED